MSDCVSSSFFGNLKANHTIVSLDHLSKIDSVHSVQVVHLFLILLLFRVVNGQQFHEKVSWVGKLGHGSVDLLEIVD